MGISISNPCHHAEVRRPHYHHGGLPAAAYSSERFGLPWKTTLIRSLQNYIGDIGTTPTQNLGSHIRQRRTADQSHVAKMNREKYIAASRISEGDKKSKGQHWLRALLRYRLKPYALTLPIPAWIFDVTDDGFIVRNPIQSHTSDGVVSDLPPWRTESSSSFSSTDRPWHEPETKTIRFTK